jgi:hypothetical protein
MSVFESLKNEGALSGYWDGLSRSFIDFSKNQNNGTPNSGVEFANGFHNDGLAGGINIGPNIIGTNPYSIVSKIVPYGVGQSSSGRLFDCGSHHVYFAAGGELVYTVSSSDVSTVSVDFRKPKTIGLSTQNNNSDLYFNGSKVDSLNIGTLLSCSSDFTIGNRSISGRSFYGKIVYFLVFSKMLTDAEQKAIYEELESMTWPTMPQVRVQPNPNASATLWKTHWGVNESVSPVTSGWLENSSFKVKSGSFEIKSGTINGKAGKLVECISPGEIWMPTNYFHQTESEAANGCWKWWWRKESPSAVMVCIFISDSIGYLIGNNYNVIYRSNEVIDLTRGTIVRINGGVFPEENWIETEVCRDDATNKFELFINGASQGTAIDGTHQVSNYLGFDADAGDKIFYSDKAGGHAISKLI